MICNVVMRLSVYSLAPHAAALESRAGSNTGNGPARVPLLNRHNYDRLSNVPSYRLISTKKCRLLRAMCHLTGYNVLSEEKYHPALGSSDERWPFRLVVSEEHAAKGRAPSRVYSFQISNKPTLQIDVRYEKQQLSFVLQRVAHFNLSREEARFRFRHGQYVMEQL